MLQSSGDRVEVAHAFVDLGETLRMTGEADRGMAMMRTAQHIARQSQAQAVLRRVGTVPPVAEPVRAGADRAVKDRLSEAEHRVAALAAIGHTNREIAGKLCLTVSTVEQHLTRVYRKLRVTRRTDLPPWLNFKFVQAG